MVCSHRQRSQSRHDCVGHGRLGSPDTEPVNFETLRASRCVRTIAVAANYVNTIRVAVNQYYGGEGAILLLEMM